MADIPAELYSDYSGNPFDTCIDCGADLLNDEVPYVIVKQIVAGETVFEMAICLSCTTKLQQEYSEESKQAIRNWFAEQAWKIAKEQEKQRQAAEGSDTPSGQSGDPELTARRLNHCHLCGTLRTEAHRYIVEAVCIGRSVVSASEPSLMLSFPLLICEKCTEGMSDQISQMTRDRWNRFVEDHFDGPPGIELEPSNRDLVLV